MDRIGQEKGPFIMSKKGICGYFNATNAYQNVVSVSQQNSYTSSCWSLCGWTFYYWVAAAPISVVTAPSVPGHLLEILDWHGGTILWNHFPVDSLYAPCILSSLLFAGRTLLFESQGALHQIVKNSACSKLLSFTANYVCFQNSS